MVRRLLMILAVTLATSAGSASAAALSPGDATHFVQDFYSWYAGPLQKSLNPRSTTPSDIVAIGQRPMAFSPALAQALKDNDRASRGNEDLTGVLDFDPFLNSQDPGKRYTAYRAVCDAASCKVSVADIDNKTRPAVIAQVARSGNHYVFVNFLYPGPGGGSLQATLRALAQELHKARGHHG
jgi:hypothetical protein